MSRPMWCSRLSIRRTLGSASQPASIKSVLSRIPGMWMFVPLFCLGLFAPGLQAQTASFSYVESTIAGTALDNPYGVAVDSSGNVYVTELAHGTVLKNVPNGSGGYTQSTVAMSLNDPVGVAVDSSSNIYIADNFDGTVVQYAPNGSGYTKTTFASGLNHPARVAVDSSGDVYITEVGNGTVLKYTPNGSGGYTQGTFASGLNSPYGIAVDSSGDVYITEVGNDTVLKYTPNGSGGYTPSTLASGLNGPYGIAVDSKGIVYVANSGSNTVLKYTPSGSGSYTQSTVISGLNSPSGVAADSNGNVYIADTINNRVLRLQTSGVNFYSEPVGTASAAQTLTFTFTAGGAIGAPKALTMGAPSPDFAVASGGTCTSGSTFSAGNTCTVNVTFTPKYAGLRKGAVELTNASGAVIATAYVYGVGEGPQVAFASSAQSTLGSGFSSPASTAVDGSGNIYVADSGNNLVQEMPPGCTTSSCVTTLGGGFKQPFGVAVDGAGNIYVANLGNNLVQEMPPGCTSSSCVTTLGGGFSSPVGITVDGSGNVYVANFGNNLVQEMPPGCTTSSCVTTLGGGFSEPYDVAVDGSGNVYVADYGNGAVKEMPTGCTSFSCVTVRLDNQAPHDYAPTGVALDAAGNIYFVDFNGGSVGEIPPGCISTKVTNINCSTLLVPAGSFNNPVGLSVDGSGNLYVANYGGNAVAEIDRADAPSLSFAATNVGATSTDSPKSVTVENIGNQTLTFQIPTTAGAYNPSVATNFSYNNASTCQQKGAGAATAFTLASSISCTVAIDFTPQISGSISGQAVLTDNSGSNTVTPVYTTQKINLNGTGNAIAPTAVVSNPPLAYGESGTDTITFSGPSSADAVPSGTVTYSINGGPAQSAVLNSSGVASLLMPATLPLGNNTVAWSYSGDSNYTPLTAQTFIQVVTKATTTITTPPTASAITYGQTLADSTLTGGTGSVPGTFAWTTPTTKPPVGTTSYSVTFTPTDTTDYNTTTLMVPVTVTKATTTITTPPTASSITYGQTLADSTLTGGTGSVPGTFAWTTLTTKPPVGTTSYSVTFTPTDTTDYNTTTLMVPITVNKATTTITTPPTASSITYGQTLADSTLTGGTGSVAGTFAWTTPTTKPPVGTASYSVTFTPTDTTDYNTTTVMVPVTVNKATTTITTPPTASAITYGQTLADSTLTGGTGSVPGNFAWTTTTTKPPVGTTSYSVTFTPTDTTDYNTTTLMVPVTVTKATTTITTPPTASAITYGQTLADSTLTGGAGSVAGTFAWTTPTTKPPAGTASYSVTFTPTDTTDYNTTTLMVPVTVTKATTTITTPPTASAITYGQTLADSTLTGGTGSVPGNFAWTTPTTKPPVGTTSYSVTFTPTDTADYNTATLMVPVTVNKAMVSITWPSPASISYGTALSATQLDATASYNGSAVAGSFVYTPAAGAVLSVGTHTLSVTFMPTDTTDYTTSSATTSISVTGAALTITANNATRVYGATNPTFTGTVTGAANGDTFTESFTTTATQTSNVGSYPIVPSVTGANLSDYTVTATNGTLTITQAATATALSASASSINPGQTLTLTAHVTDASAGSTGTPTGTVTFYDGSTVLATATLSNGVANLSTSTLAPGVTHSLTASYSGDTNFQASSSTSAISIPVAALDFSLNITGGSSQTVMPGAAASYTLQVSPTNSVYPGPVSFSVSGLPAGATATFSPSTVAANGGTQSVTFTIQTEGATAMNSGGTLLRDAGGATLAMGLLLLPLFGLRRRKAWTRMLCITLLLVGTGVFTTLATGCGAPNGFPGQQQQSYTVTVTATSGSVTKTAAVTLTVE